LNGLVKNCYKLFDRLIHDYYRRAFIHSNNTAKPVVEFDDIPGTKAERMPEGPPYETDKLGLMGIVCIFAFHWDSFSLAKEAKLPQRAMAWIAHDDVIENLYFQQLPGSIEITGHFDVCL
jgi:hypothetical protein